jgi:hypothetical protein
MTANQLEIDRVDDSDGRPGFAGRPLPNASGQRQEIRAIVDNGFAG